MQRFSIRAGFFIVLTLLLVTGSGMAEEGPKVFDLLEFEGEIQAFEASDRIEPPAPGGIVITGSSSIRLWHPTIEQDLAPLDVTARGFGGSTLAHLLYYLDRIVLNYRPRAIVVYEGDNDTGDYRLEAPALLRQFEMLIQRVRRELPQTRIYLVSIKPSLKRQEIWPRAERVNAQIEELAAQTESVFFIDVSSHLLDENGKVRSDIYQEDRLHFNQAGNRLWARTIKEALMVREGR